jgi:hypothetical protein
MADVCIRPAVQYRRRKGIELESLEGFKHVTATPARRTKLAVLQPWHSLKPPPDSHPRLLARRPYEPMGQRR